MIAVSPVLNFLLLILYLSFFPPFCEPIPYFLKDYDIWGDQETTTYKERDFPVTQIFGSEKKNYTARRGKILSYFYPSTGEECKAEDGRRSGLCLNPYRCHQQGGKSNGYCAHGFGVCCVFTVSCGKEIKQNITYFISPQFPSLSRSIDSCTVQIRKMEGASQLRLDFEHFNLGQPNRLTGDCDSDLFLLKGVKSKEFRLCGFNSGQHIYYDIDQGAEYITMVMRLQRPTLQRLWEIRVTQVRFGQRAPDGCLQYFTTKTGVIQTMNFAENGRHLANQDYKACVRQVRDMCSIVYEPCDDNSFRIGPSAAVAMQSGMFFGSMPGSFGGAGTEFVDGPAEMPMPGQQLQDDVMNDPDGDLMNSDVIGSGDGEVASVTNNNIMSRQLSPYTQHLGGGAEGAPGPQLWRYWGYGNYGLGVSSFGRQRCQDRIITPCDGDEFLGDNGYLSGSCDPFHCGSTFCPGASRGRARSSCRVETSSTPFQVGIKFGPPAPKPSPEDNIGVCLKFEQMPCT